jgi:hypothetical protein
MLRLFTAGLTLAAAIGMTPTKVPDVQTSTICKSYQHILVGQDGMKYVVRNDNYGHDRECLRNRAGSANFAVVSSGARPARGEPVAYPDIFLGCSWGVCSPHSGLPLPVNRIRSLVTTWHTTVGSSGTWDAGYDIWFDRKPRKSGQSAGAELMIWLSARGFGANTWPVVTIDHVRWHLAHWRAHGHGKAWNYIQFSRVRPTRDVTGLQVRPFIAAALRRHFLRSRWWLTSVEAGFEIWRGGVGLRTTKFMVHV